VEIKCQPDATDWFFIAKLIARSTCFGSHYAHHQELKSYADGCCPWYLALWLTSRWSGVVLWVMCPVCGMLLNMFRAPLCPSSGAQELYRWLLSVVLGALGNKSLVWCRTVGYMSGLRDAAQHVSGAIMPIIRSSRVIQMAALCGTWHFG